MGIKRKSICRCTVSAQFRERSARAVSTGVRPTMGGTHLAHEGLLLESVLLRSQGGDRVDFPLQLANVGGVDAVDVLDLQHRELLVCHVEGRAGRADAKGMERREKRESGGPGS